MNKLSLFRILLGFEVNEVHDTEPIDDDSSLHEIPFHNLYNDTELVDNCETLDHEFEEVVDDSEDDDEGGGGGGKGSVDSSKPRCVVERILEAPDTLLESDGSNDHECQTGKPIFCIVIDASDP